MSKRIWMAFAFMLLVGIGLHGLCTTAGPNESDQIGVARQALLPDQGCTVFYGADGNVVSGRQQRRFYEPADLCLVSPGGKRPLRLGGILVSTT